MYTIAVLLQVAEHENLQETGSSAATASSSYGACIASPLLQLDTMCDMGTPLLTPQPPDPGVVSRMQVRCGVNDTWPLEDAVRKVRRCAMLC